MVEKDEYDRAWERHVAAQRRAQRLEATRPVIHRAVKVSAFILVGLGGLLAALGIESLAALDACIADPACLPMASGSAFEEFFGILAVGIVLSVTGVAQLAVGLRTEPIARPD